MRTAFIEELCQAASVDSRVFLVCGDLGYSVLERFATRFPALFLNAGIAEQNMMGVAAGLALTGHIVFVYSIVNFPVMRCLEQVRNDIAYHKLNVKIVAIGGGLVYGSHGYSHHGAEDIGVMRLLPNMSVLIPADPVETRWAVRQSISRPGPTYIRLGRGGEPRLRNTDTADWPIDQPIRLRDGDQITVAGTGGGTGIALAAADRLAAIGINAAVFSVPSLVPLDVEPLFNSARKTGSLLTVEDHGRGGLGTIVAEAIAPDGRSFRFRSLHLDREPVATAGNDEDLRREHGLDVAGVIQAARQLAGNATCQL